MKRYGPKAKIKAAFTEVSREISDMARHGGRFAAGLASEGYAGGYAAALSDVLLVLDGNPPCVRPGYWKERQESWQST